MTVTLVIPQEMADEFLVAASNSVESAGVLLARHLATSAGHHRLLAREMQWVPEDAYIRRESDELVVASDGYVPALAAAEEDQAVAIWVHTHPGSGSSPAASTRDERVDQELADLFRLRSGSKMYGTLVLGLADGGLTFTGRVETSDDRLLIDRLWVTGRRFALTQNWHGETTPPPRQFDRNIRAFGGDIQRVLGDLHVAVVGCGGTGSAVTEQLVRLGVRRLSLFDSKVLTDSNLTRVYGSFPGDVGTPKVRVAASHATRIAPEAQVTTVASRITVEATARHLTDADIIFGCTDDNAGRLVLSRAACYLMTPVIDCGVLLSSGDGGRLEGIDGRVTVLVPGAACLVCRGRIDLERAAADMLDPDERQRREDEGYGEKCCHRGEAHSRHQQHSHPVDVVAIGHDGLQSADRGLWGSVPTAPK